MNATANVNWNVTEFYPNDFFNGTTASTYWNADDGVTMETTDRHGWVFEEASTSISPQANFSAGTWPTFPSANLTSLFGSVGTTPPPSSSATSTAVFNLTAAWATVSADDDSGVGVGWTNVTEFPDDCRNASDTYCLFYADEMHGMYRHNIGVTVVLCLAYMTVFLLGLFGNCFVVAVVIRSPRLRTVTNYFIANLALADILVITFCLPATLLSNIITPWVLGWMMCKTVAYVQGLSVSASVYSLVAVSLDRFLAICYPLRCQITRARAKIVIIVIWMVALVVPIPWALYFDLHEIGPPEYAETGFVCNELWPDPEAEKHYFLVANVLLGYILPLLLITYCYVMIWSRVWSRSIPGETKGSLVDQMVQKSKVKVIKMLVVVVILFMLSWLPLYVIFLRMKFADITQMTEEEGYLLSVIAPIAQWLGSANSCINPILYAFFNKKYRKGFIAIIKSRRCCGKLGSYNDELCSTISRTNFQKSRHWKNDVAQSTIDVVSTSGF